MSTKTECATCGSSAVHATTYSDTFVHRGQEMHATGLEMMRCDACGTELIEPDQARRNYRRMVDIGRTADGLLTGDAILGVRKRLGLTQHEASTLFGGGLNAFSKYERGDVVQSVPMDRLIRLVSAFPLLLELLREISQPGATSTHVSQGGWGNGAVIASHPDRAISFSNEFPAKKLASNSEYRELEAA
jgi:HTH-type transcriptional regulator/antitoxin MqsA